MNALVLVARSLWRVQARALVLLAVLGGVGLGCAATAAASARRADSAYDRLRSETLAPDALMDGTGVTDETAARLRALPEVAGLGRFSYTFVAPKPLVAGRDAGAFVGLDDDFMTRVYRPLVLRGRLPRRGATDEVVVNEALARVGGYRVGQRVALRAGDDRTPIGDAVVVGVTRAIFDVGVGASSPAMLLDADFLAAHPDVEIGPQPGLVVKLRRGDADLPAFRRHAAEIVGGEVQIQSATEEANAAERTLAVQTYGYAVLAAVALLVTAVAVVQALSRILSSALADLPTLVAMGFAPRQRLGLGAVLVAPVALLGLLVGAVGSVAASPLIPTGFARTVDPARGVQADLLVVVVLVAAWVLLVAAAGVALAWRERPERDGGRVRQPSRMTGGLPPRMRLGADAALARATTPAGVAARSALVAVAIGVAGVVAVVGFSGSLARLLDRPDLEGWGFDAAVSVEAPLADLRAGTDLDPAAVADHRWGSVVFVRLDGVVVEGYALAPGSLAPTLRAGRTVRAGDEVVLGADTMRTLGVGIGDVVTASGTEGRARLRVVGSAAFPELGNNADLASAAMLSRATARRVGAVETASMVLVERAPGAAGDLGTFPDEAEVVTPFHAPRVQNLDQVGAIPWLLGVGMALVALAGLAHGLLRSVQLRRHDLAVLAGMGYRTRDLRAILAWQATVCAGLGAVIGVVFGVLGGRLAWAPVASSTGVVTAHVVRVLTLVAVVAVAVLVANLLAVGAARHFRRTPPAFDLRTE